MPKQLQIEQLNNFVAKLERDSMIESGRKREK